MPKYLAKHYFWVCLRVFPDKISIQISGLQKAVCTPSNVGGHITQSIEGLQRIKKAEGRIPAFRLTELGHCSALSAPGPQAFRSFFLPSVGSVSLQNPD